MLGLSENMGYLLLAGFFVMQWLFAYILGLILLKFATNLGVRHHTEGMVRWTSTTKPSLGGILFFVSFLLSVVFYMAILSAADTPFSHRRFLGLVVVAIMAFIMGLADDAYNTKPWLKFIIQFLCGVAAIISGNYIMIFDAEILNYAITVFWFIGMMNSLNMLDNMDGITSSVSSVTCLFVLVIAYTSGWIFEPEFILTIGVLASILAFLRFNWHPARMYMGDSGSQFIGAFLAFIAIRILWNAPLGNTEGSFLSILFLVLFPVSFFIITISDTTTVSINRLLKKTSPFVGGKDHTTHHLVYAGLKQRQVALLYIFVSIFACITGCMIFFFELYNNLWVLLLFGLILFCIFITLFIVTKKYKNGQPGAEQNPSSVSS